MKKKIFAAITGLAVAAMIIAPSSTQAITAAELQVQIDALLAQLATLQSQLSDLGGGGGGTVTGCTITSFSRNLAVGMTGDDVKCLQIVLNSASDTQLSAGVGSPGQETSYFGPKTKAAVIKFQEKYASVVLASWGLTSGTGYVGSTTRAKLDTLLGVIGEEEEEEEEDVPAGALSVSVSSDSPAGATVPASASNGAAYNVPVLKLRLTAGNGPVTISSLKVLRSGISQDAAVDSIRLYDQDGNQIGNSQSIGSSHKANFNNISIKVPSNTTKVITIKVSMAASDTYSGNVLRFGIESADDVVSNATGVSGSFPMSSNEFTLTSSVSIGTASLYNGSLGTRNTTDLTVDPTDKDIRFTQVKILAGSAEGFIVKQITAVKNGTVASSDLTNIRLVKDNTSETLATVNELNADGRAVFNDINVEVGKGNYVELSVIADMNESGSGRTAAFDLHDGTAYTIDVVGATYGYGLTPSRDNFCALAGTCQTQTINQGYLTVQKSAETPPTGYIAIGASQVALAAFDFNAYGEGINVTSTQIKIELDPGPVDTGGPADYTNVTGYDGDGNVLFGPKDYTTTTAGGNQTLTFTDAYTLPIGANVIYIKSNVSSSALANEGLQISIPINTVVAKGATSGKTTYTTSSGTDVAPAAARTGNVQTVQGPALAVVTAGTPVAGTIVASAQNATFAYLDLDASNSGEDVKITQIQTLDASGTTGVTANTSYEDDIINLELWGDPDTTDSVTEDILLQTTTSTATQNATTAKTTFTFKTPVKVKKGTITRLTLKADVTSGADTSVTHRFLLGETGTTTGYVTSTGWSTGTAVTESYSGEGQAQTIQDTGQLKIIASPDTPAKAQFVSGTTGNTMMTYKMYASREHIAVTKFYIATGSNNDNNRAAINNVKVYYEGEQYGAAGGYTLDAAGKAFVVLEGAGLIVPKDTWTVLEFRVDFNDKSQVTDNTTLEIGLGDDDGDDSVWTGQDATAVAGSYLVTATGANSGATITATNIDSVGDSTGNVVASYQHKVYDGVLVVSKNSASPSGTATAGANKEMLRLDLQAVGDDITILEMEFCIAGTATVTGTGDVTIKSSDLGTTYATLTQSGFDAYWDSLVNAGTYYPMDPSNEADCLTIGGTAQTSDSTAGKIAKSIEPFTTTLQVAEGTTKTVKVFGDTTGAASTKTLQLSLQKMSTPSTYATTTSGIEWQNNSANAVDEALTKNSPVTGGSLDY
jgi:hypothetical protein